MRHSRRLHRSTPFLHRWGPSILQTFCLRHNVRCVESRKLSLVGWHVTHPPKKPAFWIWLMGSNIQRSLVRLQPGNDLKTRLVHSTLGFLRIFESDPDLIGDFRAFVLFQFGDRLGEIVLEQVEKCCVVIFRDETVLYQQGAISDQCFCGLRTDEISVSFTFKLDISKKPCCTLQLLLESLMAGTCKYQD
jgi:hypothetical protein